MTENKRYDVIYEKEPRGQVVTDNGIPCTARTCCTRLNWLEEENEQLKSDIKVCVKRYGELFNKYIELQKENKETEYNPPYPKRNPITYESVPEAIYNWDDKND